MEATHKPPESGRFTTLNVFLYFVQTTFFYKLKDLSVCSETFVIQITTDESFGEIKSLRITSHLPPFMTSFRLRLALKPQLCWLYLWQPSWNGSAPVNRCASNDCFLQASINYIQWIMTYFSNSQHRQAQTLSSTFAFQWWVNLLNIFC